MSPDSRNSDSESAEVNKSLLQNNWGSLKWPLFAVVENGAQ
jgi:hypothetical protein